MEVKVGDKVKWFDEGLKSNGFGVVVAVFEKDQTLSVRTEGSRFFRFFFFDQVINLGDDDE